MNSRAKVFVPDGRSLAALAIIRSLGEKGFEVHAGEEFGNNVSFFSRYAKKKEIYPSPKGDPDGFIDRMLELSEKERYDLIIPVRDDTTMLLSANQDRFSEYTRTFLSDHGSIQRLQDKGETIKLAMKCGVPVPETYFPEDTDTGDIKRNAKYPVLVRPRISSGARGIKYVRTQDEFDEAYDLVKRDYGEPIIQEYVSHEGGHYSIGTLFDKGSNPVAIHVYKETKQYPINGGPAVNAVSVKKESWVDGMLEILRELHWVGPAHMDVLYDPDSECYRLLEVNPRFWMSVNLSIKSGVDFPHLLYKLAMGEEIDLLQDYQAGLKYRWVLPNEILWLMQTPDKIDGLRQFMNFKNGETCYGVLSLQDPLPTAGIMLQGLYYLASPSRRNFVLNRGWGSNSNESKVLR